MDFTKGYTAAFYAAFLDPITWVETGRLEVLSGSVSRTADGLRQTAELTVRQYNEPIDRWIRIYMDCDQNGSRAHEPLFTGIVSTPGSDHSNAITDVHLTAYSPLKAGEDIKLQLGYYVPANKNGVRAIKDLLKTLPAPIEVQGDGVPLQESIVAEQNENCVTMTQKILDAMNWKLQIRGNGTIVLSENLDEPEPVETFGANEADVLELSYSKGRDWFNCPNVFRATSGSATATARDDDPASELSTVSRGREVQATEDNVTLAETESITQYAKRRLKELQAKTETASYTRRYLPDVNVGDAVRLNYPDLQGVYKVQSQNIALGTAARTQEEVKRTI